MPNGKPIWLKLVNPTENQHSTACENPEQSEPIRPVLAGLL
jgi:hypothetical protein